LTEKKAPVLSPDHRIVWVSGKGGVGKSLVAQALALREAKLGRRVLLVELGDRSYFDAATGVSVSHKPVRTSFGFDIALWSGESCLREYVLHLLKIQSLARLFFENRVMSALVRVAPGLNEISITGKVTSEVRNAGPEMHYDLIVVDTYATGHALALWRAASGLKEAIAFGPMGSQSREIDAVLRNPKICKYIIVTLLEDLPVAETVELVRAIKAELSSEVEVVVNREWQLDIPESELRHVEQNTGVGPHPLFEFAKQAEFVKMHQAGMRRDLGIKLAMHNLSLSGRSNDSNSDLVSGSQLGKDTDADSGKHIKPDSIAAFRTIPQFWTQDISKLIVATELALR
jgi:hypothetical protein